MSSAIDAVRAIVLDIDGVLTDGRIGYSGGDEIKFFHVRDGHGIKMARRAGFKVGAISGRSAEANRRRAAELGFDFLRENSHDKLATFAEVLAEQELAASECMYIGDDVVDMPVMRRVAVAVAVADADAMLDEVAAWRTQRPGGAGAVREAIEWLLKEQKKWDTVIAKYRA